VSATPVLTGHTFMMYFGPLQCFANFIVIIIQQKHAKKCQPRPMAKSASAICIVCKSQHNKLNTHCVQPNLFLHKFNRKWAKNKYYIDDRQRYRDRERGRLQKFTRVATNRRQTAVTANNICMYVRQQRQRNLTTSENPCRNMST